MAAKRGKNQARRNGNGGRPAWVWAVAGLAIGALLFLAVPSLLKKDGDRFARFGPRADPAAQPAPIADTEAIADTPAPQPADPAPQYDFYTVLPGNEVRMSDAELAASAREEEARRVRTEAQRARDACEQLGLVGAAGEVDAMRLERGRGGRLQGLAHGRTAQGSERSGAISRKLR